MHSFYGHLIGDTDSAKPDNQPGTVRLLAATAGVARLGRFNVIAEEFLVPDVQFISVGSPQEIHHIIFGKAFNFSLLVDQA